MPESFAVRTSVQGIRIARDADIAATITQQTRFVKSFAGLCQLRRRIFARTVWTPSVASTRLRALELGAAPSSVNGNF